MRNIYLNQLELEDAINYYYDKIKLDFNYPTLKISAKESNNFITSKAVYAKISSPNFNASAMDGIVLDYTKTLGASESSPVLLNEGVDFEYVNTGNIINNKYNCVIMIEEVIKDSSNCIKIYKPAHYFQNIRPIAEDITHSQMIIGKNHLISSLDISAIIASKNDYIEVYDKLNIAIIPTGDEIVDVSDELKTGQIIDTNSLMIKFLCEDDNYIPHIYETVKDDFELLRANLIKASKNQDVILVIAGSSAGSKDNTVDVIRELGEVFVHGIAIKPGKPAILGMINKKLVIGLPGYPVSCYIVYKMVVKRILDKFTNYNLQSIKVKAKLTKSIYSSIKYLEFIRVSLCEIDEVLYATPLDRGAGSTMSLANCHGILEIDKHCEGLLKGELVDILLTSKTNYTNVISIIGSHDLVIDLIKSQLDSHQVISSHVGSYMGLISLKNKECHIAPIHILGDGGYNISIVNQLFDEKMVLIKCVGRIQGLYLPKDNPKQIKSISDIVEKNLKFVNRQQGSGTAILFDSLLNELKIEKSLINGYDFVMPTHFNVGACVANSTCDVGIGIESVAMLLDLDFIPIAVEEYDLLIYEKDLESDFIQSIIKILKSQQFIESVNAIGGYDLNNSGEVVYL